MNALPPARIGMSLDEIDTPTLLIDLDALDRNIQRMAKELANAQSGAAGRVRLRPHAKTHKSPIIGLMQMAHGAVGVCCQKVGEAEVMVNGGIADVLVSNQVVSRSKVARLAALARRATVRVCVDDPQQVAQLSEAAKAFGVELSVLVELEVGAQRCGVAVGEPVRTLARQVEQAPGLHFGGLQAYQGMAQHLRTFAERSAAIQIAIDRVRETKAILRTDGLDCETVSGAGTGTYPLERDSGVFNELQAGSYVFMDADYGRNLGEDGAPVSTFDHSLFVLARVMSRPTSKRVVVDAGLKSYSAECGLPLVQDPTGLEAVGVSDEHGTLMRQDGAAEVSLGDKVLLIPGHCDPTVNLHDWYVGLRGERVDALWPVAARGSAT